MARHCASDGGYCACCGEVHYGLASAKGYAALLSLNRTHSLRTQAGVKCTAQSFGHSPISGTQGACWCSPGSADADAIAASAAAGGATVANRSTSRIVDEVLGPELQGEYSRRLYGDVARVAIDTLQFVWLGLLTDRALRRVDEAGGVCRRNAKYAMPPFFAPMHVTTDPPDSMWVRRNLFVSRNAPLRNFTWVEVSHCGMLHEGADAAARAASSAVGLTTAAATMASGGGWLYVARGSGVSLNVGRTLVLGYRKAAELHKHLFNHTRTACDADGAPHWHVRDDKSVAWRDVGPPTSVTRAPPAWQWRRGGWARCRRERRYASNAHTRACSRRPGTSRRWWRPRGTTPSSWASGGGPRLPSSCVYSACRRRHRCGASSRPPAGSPRRKRPAPSGGRWTWWTRSPPSPRRSMQRRPRRCQSRMRRDAQG